MRREIYNGARTPKTSISRDVSSVFGDWFLIGFEHFGIWDFLSCWHLFEFIEFFKSDEAVVDARGKKLFESFSVSNFSVFVSFLTSSSGQ